MEIMGIALVVVLVSLGLVFYLNISMAKKPSATKKEYMQSELAANFLNSLVETHAPGCSNIQLSTLFEDCASHPPDGSIFCDSKYSCQYLQDETAKILQKSLDSRNIKYQFIVSTDPNLKPTASAGTPVPSTTIFSVPLVGCDGDRKSAQQPLPSNPPVYLILHICS
jgi:hypothetical protein